MLILSDVLRSVRPSVSSLSVPQVVFAEALIALATGMDTPNMAVKLIVGPPALLDLAKRSDQLASTLSSLSSSYELAIVPRAIFVSLCSPLQIFS